MNFLLTDDEPLQLQELTSILRRIRPEAQVFAYTWPDDALEGAKSNSIDVAFLDIQTGGMSGLELALELKRLQPGVHIIFVTGFSQYAVDAFAMHASGYLLKPATEEAVLRELTFLYQERETSARVRVKTFGGVDVYVDGEPLRFGRAKSKELFAYLVDRRGCCAVSFRTSSPFRGHWKLPLSNRLYSSTKPLPSQYSALIRSFRLPQNRNSVLVNGSSWNWLCTKVASPSIPLRKSVYPQAMYTFSAPVKSLSMMQHPQNCFQQPFVRSLVELYF